MRIAFARLNHETNALSPVPTHLEAFERVQLTEGSELLRQLKPWRPEVSGGFFNAELSGLYLATRLRRDIELVPLPSAWAIPSGKLDRTTFDALVERLITALEGEGPIDGLYLCLHGAMGVVGLERPEQHLLERVRAVIGATPLAVSYDLHAVLTSAKVEIPDIVTLYRTNPHRDLAGTGARTARLLIRRIEGTIHPTTTWRSLPMVFGGLPMLDFRAPMRPIFQRMKEMGRIPGVLSVGFCQSQPLHDAPHAGWSVLVQTDGDAALAERLADELADRVWDLRHHQSGAFHSPLEALRKVRAARFRRVTGPFCLSDASDAVGAGGVGDNATILEALLQFGQGLLCYVPICDPAVVEALYEQAPGTAVDTTIGARLAPEHGEPVPVCGRLERSLVTERFGRAVRIDAGHVQILVTEHAPYAMHPRFYRQFGLSIRRADAIVVKSAFLHIVFFGLASRGTIWVRSSGTTDLGAYWHVDYDIDVAPKDLVSDWRAGDAQRRS